MSWWNGDEWRWRMRAPSSVPTITVTDLHADAQRDRDEKVKAGAQVVPFGFGRVLAPEPVESEPALWEGDGA